MIKQSTGEVLRRMCNKIKIWFACNIFWKHDLGPSEVKGPGIVFQTCKNCGFRHYWYE